MIASPGASVPLRPGRAILIEALLSQRDANDPHQGANAATHASIDPSAPVISPVTYM